MIHHVTVDHRYPATLQEHEIHDIVDTLLKGLALRVLISDEFPKGTRGRSSLRGQHKFDPLSDTHLITISYPKIIESNNTGLACGGNIVVPKGEHRLASAMTLAHEIQHGNQYYAHARGHTSFWNGRYRTRACEREARTFADESIPILAAILGVDVSWYRPRAQSFDSLDEVQLIVDVLSELDEVYTSDIEQELKSSGENNAVNFSRVRKSLETQGIKVVKG